MTELVSQKILVPAPNGQKSKAKFYFLNEQNPPSTHYMAPLAMEFEITNRCFRHCSYCAYESGPTPKMSFRQELSTHEWLALLSELASQGLMALEFTGGDPFVREDALDIILHADRLKIPVHINSDLSVLSEEHIRKLSAMDHLIAIQTSLDGASEETCDLTRGKGGFRTLIKQMEQLKDSNLPFTVGVTVHKKNYQEIPAIAKLVSQYGVAGLYIGPMYAAGRGKNMEDLVLSPAEWDRAVHDYMSVLQNGVVAPTESVWHRLIENCAGRENPVRDQLYLTPRGNSALRIDPHGNAYVSAKLRTWRERFQTVGNVKQLPVSAIWKHSRLLKELRSYPVDAPVFDAIDFRKISAETNLTEPTNNDTLALGA